MQVFTAFTALFLSLASASPQFQQKECDFTVGQIVETSSGSVAGHAATLYPEVSEYLGIPYAQPPVGDLRFAAPVKYTGSSILNGSVYVGCRLLPHHLLSLTWLRFHALGCHPSRVHLSHPLKLQLQISPLLASNLLTS